MLASSNCTQEETGQYNQPACIKSEIQFWKPDSGETAANSYPIDEGAISAMAYQPQDNSLAVAVGENIFYPVRPRTRALFPRQPLSGHTASITSLAFSPDGRILSSTGKDQTIVLWDTANLQPIGAPLNVPSGLILSLLRWQTSPIEWEARNCDLDGRNLTDDEMLQFLPNQSNLTSLFPKE